MNILVINVARIGDTLLITPILRAIKQAYPDHKLGCLAHPKRMEVLQGLPFIDTLAGITPGSQWWRARLLRQRPWDAALVYGQDAPLIRYASRVAKQVVAFNQPLAASNRLLSHCVAKPDTLIHAVKGRLLLANALGIHTDDFSLSYQVTAEESHAAQAWLQPRLPQQSGPLVGMQFTSFATKWYRDWPIEQFMALADALRQRHPAICFVLLGDKHNLAKEEMFYKQFPQHTVCASGLFTLRQSAALMQRLHLYIGVDTGPTHLAGALRIPMVALYHCRFPGRNLIPLGHPLLRMIEHPHPHSPCPEQTPMQEIAVATVRQAAQELLQATGW
ncbi:MAG: glycosyltransferase family 9 protein [Magnetococcales bacterium]|nr:glycosyltransferase family 9 protein [Magnetococcales bacterium]